MLIRGLFALLCCLLTVPVGLPAWAAIAEVASQRATSGTCDSVNDCSTAFPNNVTAGSLLVVLGAAADDVGPPTLAVTDTVSTT